MDDVHYWTDSSNVPCWLNNGTRDLKTFAANRVVQIHCELHLCNWRHVPSAANPADAISRGLSVKQLQLHSLWWKGPSFLPTRPDHWPKSFAFCQERAPSAELDIPNVCLAAVAGSPSKGTGILTPKVTDPWQKLIQITAYVMRILKKGPRSSLVLEPDELQCAREVQFKLPQKEDKMKLFEDFRNLNPESDSSGLICAHG